MDTIVYGEKIVKSFTIGNQRQNVLKGIDIQIEKGDFIVIMGASGSGKSTLLYALSGMDQIDEGKIKFLSKDIAGLTENEMADIRRKHMGFVFQQPTFLKNLNIIDNIILTSMKDHPRNKKEIVEKACGLMKRMGIESLIHRDITQVSGGQSQRAGICRALMNDPYILFSDEPTGALNSKSSKEVMDIFTDLNRQGTTMLLVTHDPNVAARGKQVLFMQDGKVIKELQLQDYQEEKHQERVQKITIDMQTLDM